MLFCQDDDDDAFQVKERRDGNKGREREGCVYQEPHTHSLADTDVAGDAGVGVSSGTRTAARNRHHHHHHHDPRSSSGKHGSRARVSGNHERERMQDGGGMPCLCV